jgi:hypothetical protein
MAPWNLTWLQETAILMQRAWLNISRDPRAVKAAMGQAILLGLIVGFLFFQLGYDQVLMIPYISVCMFYFI